MLEIPIWVGAITGILSIIGFYYVLKRQEKIIDRYRDNNDGSLRV